MNAQFQCTVNDCRNTSNAFALYFLKSLYVFEQSSIAAVKNVIAILHKIKESMTGSGTTLTCNDRLKSLFEA